MGHGLWFSNKIESKKCIGHIKQFFTVISHSNWWAIKMNLTRFDSFLGRILVCMYEGSDIHVLVFQKVEMLPALKNIDFQSACPKLLITATQQVLSEHSFCCIFSLEHNWEGEDQKWKKDNFLVFTHHNQTWRSYKYVSLF